MNDDFELIGKYCQEGVEAAFAELVNRHLDLVYSVAYRQVGGNEAWARDVCQEVFISLAREAEGLGEDVIVSGWLYRAARFAALNRIRMERRRGKREQEAHVMGEVDRIDDIENWEEVRPVLDEAIRELKNLDRAAVCLRFYEKRSFSEIGDQLSLGENAARMRVSRALDKLNGVLSKKGIRSTSMALGAALAGQSALAAPVGLSVSIVNGIGFGSVAAGGSVVGTLITVMSTSKISLVGLSLVASLVVGTVIYEQGRLKAGQLQVDELREKLQAAGDYDGELKALKTGMDEIKLKRTALEEESRMDPDEVGPHGFTLLEMEEAMEQWAGRVGRLVDFVGENDRFRIPEMELLESKEWLEAVGEKELSTDADFRMLLARVRKKGKQKVLGKLVSALRDYVEANPGTFPASAHDISEYIEGNLDASILDRYDVVDGKEKWPDWKGGNSVVLFEERPADSVWEYPSWFSNRINGGVVAIPGIEVWGPVDGALKVFESEMGRVPIDADELRPYVEDEINEDLYQEVYAALTTVVEMGKGENE